MIDISKNMQWIGIQSQDIITKKRTLLGVLSFIFLLKFIVLATAFAEPSQSSIKNIQLAQNDVNFNWQQGRFQKKRQSKLRVKKRTKKRKVRKVTRRKVRKKVRNKRRRNSKNKAILRTSSRANKLAQRNRLLQKKLHILKQKDVCGYPWVYAYKYKKCICERRGFTQLGAQCVRLSRYCQSGSSWSSIKRKCICKAGFEYQNKKCVNVALLDDEDDEDDEEPPIMSGASCNAPANFAALSQSVGECPDGYKVMSGKCTLINAKPQQVATKIAVPKPQPKMLPKIGAKIQVKTTQNSVEIKKNQGAPTVVSSLPFKGLDEPIYDLAEIRSCLHQAGFKGAGSNSIKKSAFKETYDAFKKFRQHHKLTHKAMDIYDLESQKILFDLCRGSARKAVVPPLTASRAASNVKQPTIYQRQQSITVNRTSDGASIGSDDGYLPVQVTGATRPFIDPASQKKSCLPSDLYDFLTTTYSQKTGLEKCAKPCLPAPTTMSAADQRSYGEKFNITWCKTCLKVSSYMPLEEVLKVERNAKVQVCTNPATTLQFSKEAPRFIGRSYPKARRLYRDFPESASDVNTIAVIIGNKDYTGTYSKNANALNDAGAMFSLLSEHLGYAPDNIFDLRNASLAQMDSVLGSQANAHGKLWQRMQKHPQSRVMIYYSGHAMNNARNNQNYLLPIDAVKGREARTGYSIALLLNNLRKLRASSIMLVLETEFGRKTGNAIMPPNASEISLQLQSSVPVPGLTIFMASHGNQKALEDPDYGIGLFTRYFISGLAGKADRKPIGNSDGKIDVVELYVHTAHKVRLAARKSFGLLQNPTLGQTGNMVISRLKN